MTTTTSRPVGAPAHATGSDTRRELEAARETTWRKPSFAKKLFLGRFDLDLIHPHPEPGPESVARGEAFLERLRQFADAEIDGQVIEREARIPDQVIKGLRDLGAFGMKIPEEYGGLDLSQVYYNRALTSSRATRGR